jgi:outer membrane protein assembly factor BamB
MKDGWTHAVNEGGSLRWVFPPATLPFTTTDGTVHGDTRYLRPGAAWGDVYITITGGLNVTTSVTGGYRRLHAFNACAAAADRVRWIVDIPGASGTYALGPPTVSRGMVFVGTSSGRLIVVADPSIALAAGWRCVNPDVPAANCVANGFTLVPEPSVLASVQLDGAIRTEPAIIGDPGVYVATDAGKVYRLDP